MTDTKFSELGYAIVAVLLTALWWGYVVAAWHFFLILKTAVSWSEYLPNGADLIRSMTTPPWYSGAIGTVIIAIVVAVCARLPGDRRLTPVALLSGGIGLLLCLMLWTAVCIMVAFTVYPQIDIPRQ